MNDKKTEAWFIDIEKDALNIFHLGSWRQHETCLYLYIGNGSNKKAVTLKHIILR